MEAAWAERERRWRWRAQVGVGVGRLGVVGWVRFVAAAQSKRGAKRASLSPSHAITPTTSRARSRDGGGAAAPLPAPAAAADPILLQRMEEAKILSEPKVTALSLQR